MSRAVILQHAPHVGPGRIGLVFRDFGIPVDIRHTYRGDEVPADPEETRILVLLGGPQRLVGDWASEQPYLATELEIVKRRVEYDLPVLGINLGAQMIAIACGAKVYENRRPGPTPDQPGEQLPEFGWEPVRFPFPGGTEPVVMGLMDGAMMFHWHLDTFDLPKLPPPANPPPPPAPAPPTGNSLLSTSERCKNQAFRFKTRLFGFQYHIELTREGIDAMLDGVTEEETQVIGSGCLRRIRQETPEHYSRYARLGDRILRNLVQFLKIYGS